jgi:chromosome segregation and condensation protein ScpB
MQRLVESIPFGINNSVSAAELARINGTNVRRMQQTIASLRRQGVIICSNSDSSLGKTGYYRPLTQEELTYYVSQETSRIHSLVECLNPAKEYLMKGESLKTQ